MSSMSCCSDLMYSIAHRSVVTFVLFAPDNRSFLTTGLGA
jgi:hypothetical protein